MFRITDTVKHLLIINGLMFLGTLLIGEGRLFYEWFALYFPKNPLFQPWQLVTHMFMHGNFQHILFNMFALWMFGTTVEQVLGKPKFLFFYFSCGLGAALLQLGYYYINYIPVEVDLVTSGLTKDQIIQMLSTNEIVGYVTNEQNLMLQELF